MSTTPATTASSDDDDLQFTQRHRRAYAQSFVKPNPETGALDFPADPKEGALFLKTLEGIDRQVLTRQRNAAEAGLGSALQETAAAIAAIFKDPRALTFNREMVTEVPVEAREIPQLKDEIVVEKMVAGELVQGTPTEDYRSFVERMNGRDA